MSTVDFQELLLSYAPVVLSLLAAWALARRGRVTLGLLTSVLAPFLLWLVIARWQYPDPNWCRYDTCPFGPYVDRVLNDHLLFGLVVLPMGLALAPAQFLIRRDRTAIGLSAGVITLLTYWATMEWVIFYICGKCRIREPTCCELAGLGVIFYAVLAILEILLLLLLGFVWRRTLRRRNLQPSPPPTDQAA